MAKSDAVNEANEANQPPPDATQRIQWVPRPRMARVRPGTALPPPPRRFNHPGASDQTPGAVKNGVLAPPGVPASPATGEPEGGNQFPYLGPYANGAVPVESPAPPLPPPAPVPVRRLPTRQSSPAKTPPPPVAPVSAASGSPRPASAPVNAGRAVGIIGLLFVANRGLGLLRDVIIAGAFGTGPEINAYYAAFRLPDFLFLVIASGAFGAALIPVFVGFLERDREADAWRLASSVLNSSALALAALAGVGFLLAEPLMGLIAPGLASEPFALAVSLTRILLVQPILLGVGGAAMGILNAQGRFTLPALAPVTYNLGIIAGAVLLAPRFGVAGLAYGVVLGAAGHLLTQMPALLRVMRYRPIIDFRAPGMRQVWSLLVPRMFGQAVFALNYVVLTNLASRLGDGRIAAFGFAYTLFLLPHGVFVLSAATVLFPALSRDAEAGDWDAFRERYAAALRGVFFFIVPATAVLIALRYAIPEAVFQLGAFTSESTEMTALVLGAMSTGLIAFAFTEVATRAFYAVQDTRTPVLIGVITFVVNVPLSIYLGGLFDVAGLALSLALTTWGDVVLQAVLFERRVKHAAPGVLAALVPVFWATAAMCVALAPCVWVLTNLRTEDGKSVGQLLFLGFTLVVAAASYLGTATLLRVPEVERVRGMVLRRLRR